MLFIILIENPSTLDMISGPFCNSCETVYNLQQIEVDHGLGLLKHNATPKPLQAHSILNIVHHRYYF